MSKACYRTSLILAVSAVLSACGGGSGSSVSTDGGDPAALSLGAGNYQAVGQAAISSAFYLGSTSGLASSSPGGPLRLRQALAADRRQPVAVVGPITVLCGQGGGLGVSFSDANNNGEFEVGDTLIIEASACKEDGATTQGRIDLGMEGLSGVYGGSSFSATLAMKLTAFGVSEGNNAVQGDGNLSLKFSQTPAGVGEIALTVPRLSLTGRVSGQSFSSTLTDMQLTLREEPVSGSSRASLSYAGTLASSAFDNKQVRISTSQPLLILGSDAYPSSGTLQVRGAVNTALRITAVNSVQVRMELDADGDGTFETSVVKNWAELL